MQQKSSTILLNISNLFRMQWCGRKVKQSQHLEKLRCHTAIANQPIIRQSWTLPWGSTKKITCICKYAKMTTLLHKNNHNGEGKSTWTYIPDVHSQRIIKIGWTILNKAYLRFNDYLKIWCHMFSTINHSICFEQTLFFFTEQQQKCF